MITVEIWGTPIVSGFVRVDGKRPDGWFARYTLGYYPPRYPVPATLLTTLHARFHDTLPGTDKPACLLFW